MTTYTKPTLSQTAQAALDEMRKEFSIPTTEIKLSEWVNVPIRMINPTTGVSNFPLLSMTLWAEQPIYLDMHQVHHRHVQVNGVLNILAGMGDIVRLLQTPCLADQPFYTLNVVTSSPAGMVKTIYTLSATTIEAVVTSLMAVCTALSEDVNTGRYLAVLVDKNVYPTYNLANTLMGQGSYTYIMSRIVVPMTVETTVYGHPISWLDYLKTVPNPPQIKESIINEYAHPTPTPHNASRGPSKYQRYRWFTPDGITHLSGVMLSNADHVGPRLNLAHCHTVMPNGVTVQGDRVVATIKTNALKVNVFKGFKQVAWRLKALPKGLCGYEVLIAVGCADGYVDQLFTLVSDNRRALLGNVMMLLTKYLKNNHTAIVWVRGMSSLSNDGHHLVTQLIGYPHVGNHVHNLRCLFNGVGASVLPTIGYTSVNLAPHAYHVRKTHKPTRSLWAYLDRLEND